jgi:Tfp pilus assembly protein PilF
MKSYFFFLLLLFSQLSSFAQYDKTKVNKKALSLFDDAKVQMGLMQTANAKKLLLKAVVLDPSFCDALILLGDIYKEDKEPNKAIELYKHAISTIMPGAPMALFEPTDEPAAN